MVMPSVAVAVWQQDRISHWQSSPVLNSWNRKSRGVFAMDKLLEILQAVGIPFAYDHFAEGESPEPPFICYLLPDSDNFSADGRAYYKVNEVHIELYTDTKGLSVERQLEAVLDEHGIFYDRSEVWIESEKLYEVLYSFEMEA
nr:MAG TPA: tail completion protein [Caudoviricetes sp.]